MWKLSPAGRAAEGFQPGSARVVSGGQGLYHLVEAGLVAGGLVSIDDALVGHAVDHGHGRGIGLRCRFLVAFLDGLYDVLYVRAHFRTQAHVMEPRLFLLTSPLLRGFDVCHSLNSVIWEYLARTDEASSGCKEPRIIGIRGAIVNVARRRRAWRPPASAGHVNP